MVPVTIAAARSAKFPQRVALKGVVVTAIASNSEAKRDSCSTATPNGWYASFWVADPARPQDAVYVFKHCSDLPTDFQVAVGDVLDLDGYIGIEKNYVDREAYRTVVKSQYDFIEKNQRPGTPLRVTKMGTMAPLGDLTVTSGFGDAQGGAARASPTYAGARVHLAGPLSITNAQPTALRRLGESQSGSAVYFGFEVTGGVLVNNYKTYRGSTDGGVPGCDWRSAVADGGSVVFPDGIRGAWDTYAHAPCEDGGTSADCRRSRGLVPGIPDASFTYVLYPMDCETDLAGR